MLKVSPGVDSVGHDDLSASRVLDHRVLLRILLASLRTCSLEIAELLRGISAKGRSAKGAAKAYKAALEQIEMLLLQLKGASIESLINGRFKELVANLDAVRGGKRKMTAL